MLNFAFDIHLMVFLHYVKRESAFFRDTVVMSFANFLQSKSWQSAKSKNVQVFMGFANIEGCNVNELGVAYMLSQICHLKNFLHLQRITTI